MNGADESDRAESGGGRRDAGWSGGLRSRLLVPSPVLEAIGRDLEDAYPAEGCGVLLGEADGEVRRAHRRVPADNRVPDRNDRYEVDPDLLRELLEQEDRGGPRIVGFYHSHPDVAPVPSETDRGMAWPWYAYLIVPVREGRAGVGRVWFFDGEDGAPLEGELREMRDDGSDT